MPSSGSSAFLVGASQPHSGSIVATWESSNGFQHSGHGGPLLADTECECVELVRVGVSQHVEPWKNRDLTCSRRETFIVRTDSGTSIEAIVPSQGPPAAQSNQRFRAKIGEVVGRVNQRIVVNTEGQKHAIG